MLGPQRVCVEAAGEDQLVVLFPAPPRCRSSARLSRRRVRGPTACGLSAQSRDRPSQQGCPARARRRWVGRDWRWVRRRRSRGSRPTAPAPQICADVLPPTVVGRPPRRGCPSRRAGARTQSSRRTRRRASRSVIVVAVRAGQTKVLPDGRIEYVGILRAEADHAADLVARNISDIHAAKVIRTRSSAR